MDLAMDSRTVGMTSAKSIKDLSEMVKNLTMRNYHLEEKVKEQSRKLRESSETRSHISDNQDQTIPASLDDVDLIELDYLDTLDEQIWLVEMKTLDQNYINIYEWMDEDMDTQDPDIVSALNSLFIKMNDLSRGTLSYSNSKEYNSDKSSSFSKSSLSSPAHRSSVDTRTYKKGKIKNKYNMNETFDFEELNNSTSEGDNLLNDKKYAREYFDEDEEEVVYNNFEGNNTFRDVEDIQTAARLQEESLRMSSSSYSNLDEDYDRLCRPKENKFLSRELNNSRGSSLDGSAKSGDSSCESPFGSQNFEPPETDTVYSSLPNLTQRKILQTKKPYPHSYGSGAIMNKHKSDSRLSRPSLSSRSVSNMHQEPRGARLQGPRMNLTHSRNEAKKSRSPAHATQAFHDEPSVRYGITDLKQANTAIPRPQSRLPGPRLSNYKTSKKSLYGVQDDTWKEGCF